MCVYIYIYNINTLKNNKKIQFKKNLEEEVNTDEEAV
jgi:hypothetical protein